MRGEEVFGRRPYLGRQELAQLRTELSGRDLAIIGQIADLRLMSAKQIEAVHFSVGEHDSALAAARACQRVLRRLHLERLLARLERRVGGIHSGSSSHVYGLGPVGHRLLALDGPRRRYREPTQRFFEHTLAISQLVVDLTLAARAGQVDILACQPEPRCWRSYSSSAGRLILRPDLFTALGVGDYEPSFFIEVDRGHESLPVLVAKCRQYQAYYQSGKEQAAHGVFPRVCWSMPTPERAERLATAIANDPRLNQQLFRVVPNADMPAALWRANDER